MIVCSTLKDILIVSPKNDSTGEYFSKRWRAGFELKQLLLGEMSGNCAK